MLKNISVQPPGFGEFGGGAFGLASIGSFSNLWRRGGLADGCRNSDYDEHGPGRARPDLLTGWPNPTGLRDRLEIGYERG